MAANLAASAVLYTPCEIQPTSEYQIRPLAALEPEQQRKVWEEAVKTAPAGKAVTFKHVKATVKELTAPAPEPNSPSASHSGFAYSGPPRRVLPPLPPLRPVVGLWRPREQLIYLVWWRSGSVFQGAGAPAGEVGQEKGDGFTEQKEDLGEVLYSENALRFRYRHYAKAKVVEENLPPPPKPTNHTPMRCTSR